jgi:hypothetical protein
MRKTFMRFASLLTSGCGARLRKEVPMKKVTLVTTVNTLIAIQRAKLALVLLAAVSITLLWASPAKAGTTLTNGTCPVTITQPGEYTLGTDVGPCAPGFDGILITASNVTLHLNGHTISGTAMSGTCNNSSGIHVMGTSSFTPLTMVRVLGTGTITNFVTGFLAENSAGSFVKFVTVTQTPPTPCSDFTLGFDIQASSSQWKLEGNVVREPGDNSAGIVLRIGANDCDLVRNDVNDTISVNSNNNNIINNIGNDNIDGIGVTGNDNEIHANTTDNNSEHGLWLTCNRFNCASGNKISGNTSLGNSLFDMEDDSLDNNCDNNKWRGNKFKTANPPSCIH